MMKVVLNLALVSESSVEDHSWSQLSSVGGKQCCDAIELKAPSVNTASGACEYCGGYIQLAQQPQSVQLRRFQTYPGNCGHVFS